jgi:hypothetical protein
MVIICHPIVYDKPETCTYLCLEGRELVTKSTTQYDLTAKNGKANSVSEGAADHVFRANRGNISMPMVLRTARFPQWDENLQAFLTAI